MKKHKRRSIYIEMRRRLFILRNFSPSRIAPEQDF
jgi:hypothetical protein